ncbi:MAG: bifunctional metallophosphatase/5'-nucleotidase [Clostridiaceae bacterium]|nr:bifunctional metallophosphatase/5'-nucleotidase [Clostridiaceae bacterium]
MKKFTSLFLSLVIVLLLFLPTAAAADTSAKELTVLFSHDMHSYVDSKSYELNGEIHEVGGFAKIKTIIDEVTAKENTLVVDGGDFSMGTLYQTVFSEQAIELRMLGFMGYDVVTLGNHEFDYSSGGLAEMLKSAMKSGDRLPKMVISNIDFENSVSANAKLLQETMADFGVAEYLIFQKGDVKIAVFGGLGADADSCAPNSELIFKNMVDQAKITVAKIQEEENPDLIICLSHSGTWDDPKNSEDEILAKEVPEIDLIVSGHTHSLLEQPIVSPNNTYVVSCGEYGQNFGRIDLLQNDDGSWSSSDYKLIPIDENITADPETLGKIDEYREYVNEFLAEYGFEDFDQIVAYSPYTFTGLREMNENQVDQAMGNLISDALIHGVKEAEGANYIPIDVAIVPVGIIRAAFKEGPITISDIYEVMSLGTGPDGIPGYPLANVYLTGKELKTVAEIDASITPIFESAQLYSSGLSYIFNPNRIILNRATDVKLVGENAEFIEIDDTKLYRVVADLYSAQMLGAVTDMSKGILSLELKDAAGNIVEDLNQLIIYDEAGNEAKEWYALASYMQSFDKVDGVPTIPAVYATAQNRKVLEDSKNPVRIFRQLNLISIIILVVILLLVVLLVLLIRFIVKRVKRRRQRRKAA